MGQCLISTNGSGGIDPDELTATRSQVLAGYTAGVKGEDEPVSGTMPEKGAWTGSVGMNGSITIPEGHHNGTGKVTGPVVTQRGAWGSAVAMNAQVTIPEGYHNGSGKVSGPAITLQNPDISGSDRVKATNISTWNGTICLGIRNGRYYNGVNWVQADIPGLTASNIKENISIGNIKGTMKDYSYLATGQTSFNMGTYSGVLANGFWEFGHPIQQFDDGSVQISGTKTIAADRMVLSKKSIHLGPFNKIRIEFSPKSHKSESYNWLELICGLFPKTSYSNGYTVIDRATGQQPPFSPHVDHYDDWYKNGVYTYEFTISAQYKNDFWFLGIQGSLPSNNRRAGLIALRKIEFLT